MIKIIVDYHGIEKKYEVPYGSVGNTLRRLGIELAENDVLPFDKDDFIFPNQTISIPEIETKERKENVPSSPAVPSGWYSPGSDEE